MKLTCIAAVVGMGNVLVEAFEVAKGNVRLIAPPMIPRIKKLVGGL
jgi:hypothetical protein